MNQQVIKLSDKAAQRIKEIMSKAEDKAIGVRIGVKSGGCAGMSYVMEYAKEIKPNEEIINDKGVKVLIDPSAIIYLLGTEMDYKRRIFHLNLFLKTQTKLSVVGVASPLKHKKNFNEKIVSSRTSQVHIEYFSINLSL